MRNRKRLKASRICWNSNGWRKPSGRSDKSKDKKSHENKYGYGYEEWLFDLDKIIDGYHYAALWPIGKHRDNYEGKAFNITLYTYNSQNRTWYWGGEIKNVEIIDKNTSKKILSEYESKGWFAEMRQQIAEVDADLKNFECCGNDLFNIRFKPVDAVTYDENPMPFTDTESVSHNRYTLLNKEHLSRMSTDDDLKLLPVVTNRYNQGVGRTIRIFHEKTIEYKNIHAEIQKAFVEWLIKKYPNQKISEERGTHFNTRIDVVRENEQGDRIFYEIKSFSCPKISIRVAIGQLLEYAFFPKQILAKELVIVSHAHADQKLPKYLNHLKELFGIPISYVQFDYESKKILQEF